MGGTKEAIGTAIDKLNRISTITQIILGFSVDPNNFIRYGDTITQLVSEMDSLISQLKEDSNKYPLMKTIGFDECISRNEATAQGIRYALEVAKRCDSSDA